MKWFLLIVAFSCLSCHSKQNIHILASKHTTKIYVEPLGDFPSAYSSNLFNELKKITPKLSYLNQ